LDLAETLLSVYRAIISLSWLVFFVAWAMLALAYGGEQGSRRSTWSARGVRLLLAVIVIFGLFSLDSAPVSRFGELPASFQAIGAALAILGLVYATWARMALGRNWGMPMTRHESPELVTSGPYRLVRHPIYTGLIAMWIGTSLVYPFAAVLCAFMIVYMVFSSLREERDMEERFPEAYSAYKRRSKMLVPFLL
jgi:protein-S-isoprenylcysteine O-methyltransferase Ste14